MENRIKRFTELTPDMTILGSVELTEIQATLINKFAQHILTGTVEQAAETYKTIFDKYPQDDTEMRVFASLCQFVVDGNQLEGRPVTWADIPPERR